MRRYRIAMGSLLVLALGALLLAGCPKDRDPDAVCGNGLLEEGEECDDGNALDGDGCSAQCTNEGSLCGNGDLDPGEECDDGNNVSGDGCSAACRSEVAPECGNNILEMPEECDDGNTVDGDGCSANCLNEAVCGNGVVEGDEECDDGNTVDGDGCEGDCTLLGAVVCQTMTPLPSGVCEVTAGDENRLLVGTVLTPNLIYRGGEVLINSSGFISCVGCDCAAQAGGATVVRCPQGVISPGLINTHDHITYAHNFPYTDTGERYEHRHDWRTGTGGHTEIPYSSGATTEEVQWGELRFLLGGATSVNGSGQANGFLRNLDRSAQEGLGQPQVHYETFPLGDAGGTLLDTGCNYPSIDTNADIAGDDSYTPHISEGINDYALNEFVCTSSTTGGGEDLLEPQSAYIHAVGLHPMQYAQMAEAGTGLIWSPRSNITLYGDTAQITVAARVGVKIALGTDWIPSGSMNMQRELQCADSFNQTYLNGFFSDQDLWLMATLYAAEVLAVDDAIGSLATGRVADIAIFDGSANADHRAVIDAQPQDVALVMRGGEVLYGDDGLVTELAAGSCDAMDVCSVAKRLCAESDIGMNLAALQAAVGTQYELFFCGTPDNEPSCHPERPASVNGSTVYDGVPSATDTDGDGIPDASDNCVDVFNPIRPMDDGTQADFDGDGAGDVCDPCPIDANTTQCTTPDPNDVDGDGEPNATDNCPNTPNPLQEDDDSDGRGNVCDDCPTVYNPPPLACPATIYDIKQGNVTGEVAVLNALVTACADGYGFYVQVKPGDADYAGVDFSGVYTYQPGVVCGTDVSVGDRVDINPATISDYYGQTQLGFATVSVLSSGESLMAPEVVTPAAASSASASPLESVLVRVENVVVTELEPTPGPGDSAPTNEFVVDNTLRVNDYLYLVTPMPTVGTAYTSITGILEWRNGNYKVEVRDATDLVEGAPILLDFAPALSYIREGQTGVTIPTPLTVTLSGPAQGDTTIDLTYGDPSIVSGPATVVVPNGATSAPLSVTGGGTAGTTQISATLNSATLYADVRNVGAAETPQLVALLPTTGSVSYNSTLDFEVFLDIPADAGGTTVALSLSPGTFGTIPANVTVPADQLSALFTFTSGATAGSETITATLGVSHQATVDITGAPSFTDIVIVEVYYDHTGSDDGYEWVKLYNGTGAPVDLSNYSLGWAGTDYAYGTMQLSGTIQPGSCYLVGGPNGNTASGFPGAPTFDLALDFNPDIQNSGTAGDGVAIFDVPASSITATTTPVHAVIYGPNNSNGLYDETGPNGDVDVADAPAESSIHMRSDGTWAINSAPAPLDCLPFPSP